MKYNYIVLYNKADVVIFIIYNVIYGWNSCHISIHLYLNGGSKHRTIYFNMKSCSDWMSYVDVN